MGLFDAGIFTRRDQISAALYGKVIFTAMIVALESSTRTAGEVIVALLTAAIAFVVVHAYTELLARDIATGQSGRIRELVGRE